MAVFPESMNKLDVNDTTGSFNRIENYIRYMTERVEFAMRNMTRNVSDAGVSSVYPTSKKITFLSFSRLSISCHSS